MAARNKVILVLLVLLGVLMPSIRGLSWRQKSVPAPRRVIKSSVAASVAQPSADASIVQPSVDSSQSDTKPHNDYGVTSRFTTVLEELKELETKPLCHRVASRILINNCKLVDGKNDATIYTHSEHTVRNFMDAYAISLALCDMERGSIPAPATCAQFEEDALVKLSMYTDEPRLHVATSEIRLCLAGLSETDTAWATWMSYSKHALDFCEAARSDNYKCKFFALPAAYLW